MVIEPPVAVAAKRTWRSDNAGRSCATSGPCPDGARRLDHGSLAVDPKIWPLDWPDPSLREHTVTSRVIGAEGKLNQQWTIPW